MVYQQGEVGLRPVTRVEVMSPSNKPSGIHAANYLAHRDETLLAGINLVEVDLLHERRSPIKLVRSYPKREERSAPYVILVTDPHPNIHAGQTAILYFHVDDPLPDVRLPLLDDDGVVVSLRKVYSRTFAANPYCGMYLVDYARLPVRFETYAQHDQDRIRSVTTRAKEYIGDDSA